MDKPTYTFLKAVLGNDGAAAMRRAVAKDPRLEYYLVPRTILGWVLNKAEFEGQVPGTEVYVQFQKSEKTYSGSIGARTEPVRPFEGDIFQTVAEIATGMGFEAGSFEGTDRMLATLGKSVDALIQARGLTRQLVKAEAPGPAHLPDSARGAPQAPLAPTKQPKTRLPMRGKGKVAAPTLKVEKGDLKKSCAACGISHFKNGKFSGCMCWRDLAKHATTTIYSDGAVVEFSKSADPKMVQTLLREFNG